MSESQRAVSRHAGDQGRWSGRRTRPSACRGPRASPIGRWCWRRFMVRKLDVNFVGRCAAKIPRSWSHAFAIWAFESRQIGRESITDRATHSYAIVPASEADLFVANSGTTMRFLTALVSLGHGRYRLDGVPRMRERPIEDLLVALRQLGVRRRRASIITAAHL